MDLKRTLVGTRLGRLALSARDAAHLAAAAVARPESAGTLFNDHLAGVLTARLCRPGATFLDVGAHIGSVVARVASHNPTARVIAFEPVPDKADHLRRAFPGVECHSCALGESEGDVILYVHTRRPGYSSLGRPSPADAPNVTAVTVPLRTLDGVVSAPDVDLVKVDVEGAELGVLRGGEQLFARC